MMSRCEPGNGPGAYLLFEAGNGYPHYVGRSDNNLKDRLDHEGCACPSCGTPIQYYNYKDCSTIWEAFKLECAWYHEHLDSICNKIHPAAPAGTKWRCPVQGCEK